MYQSPSSNHHHEQQPMSSGGLLRYRSAPSSLLGELCEDFLPARSSCPETAADVAIVDRFLAEDGQIRDDMPPAGGGGAATGQRAPLFAAPALAERSGALFSPASQQMMMLHSQQNQQQQQQLARKMEQIKNGGGAAASRSSNLVRHSSSPAGLFPHLNADLGYQPKFSSRQNPIMSQISEDVVAGSSSDESSGYMPGLPPSDWENSSRGKNIVVDDLNPPEPELMSNHMPPLIHPFSLPPKPSPETAAIENYLHFHDSVPCKLRAKRGFATHPRSIAERVRRTRISERIKKLQELVPNMDTQTNTADMLDFSISYIKDLQKQVQTLSESRSSCTCSSGN